MLTCKLSHSCADHPVKGLNLLKLPECHLHKISSILWLEQEAPKTTQKLENKIHSVTSSAFVPWHVIWCTRLVTSMAINYPYELTFNHSFINIDSINRSTEITCCDEGSKKNKHLIKEILNLLAKTHLKVFDLFTLKSDVNR